MAHRAMKQVGLVLILILSVLSPVVSAESVFEETDHLSSYSRAVQLAFARCTDTDHSGTWLVVSEHVEGTETLLPHSLLIESTSLEIKRMLSSNQIEVACAQIENNHESKSVPNDPKFGDQWHLRNTGQTSGVVGEDANVTGVWDAYQGTNVTIGIVDDGLDLGHPDLSTNYDSTHDWDYCGNDGNPSPTGQSAHGTAAAGVAAATGNNSVGVSGAAPDANLVGLRLIACSISDWSESDALSHENQVIDIYSNSWGPGDNGAILEAPGPLMVAAFEDDVANGRGGLGNIITWAAGNGLGSDDDSNKDGYANARQTIAVTAISHTGDQSYYAEPGANILVAAHSNGDGEAITTTDVEGSAGYTSNDYTDDFGGTSSATPLASGVIALMLEANANLTWRDVQHVLAHSARQNDATDSGWNVNGAGHDVSHKYGFGAIDAGAAVALAENWTTVDPAINITTGTRSIGTAIPDNNGSVLNETVYIPDGLQVEHVEVIVDIDHTYRGDLVVTLTSPSGTESTLAQKHGDSGNNYRDWMFSTVHNWDEYSAGNWTLSVEDQGSGDTGTWNDWELIIHGVPIMDSDGDGLSNDNETDIHGTDPYDIDTDDDGLTDYEEVMVTFTDPVDHDSDDDTLSDGIEVNTHGTNPLSNDTDGDGMTDSQEIFFYHTDPLVPDPDTDADGWYWFQDCNDTNPLVHPAMQELLNGIDDDCDEDIDEGFSVMDSDNDGLSDYAEYYDYLTNRTNPDTDGDGLSDGDEVIMHGTDPLVPDADADMDDWYWFQDCNESDFNIHPGAPELLNGIDDDCDEDIDEDFNGSDSDGDGLLDLDEFNIYNTNPFDDDTDDDGLFDGEEINQTFTDPLVPDLDADGDGFRWFEECNDEDSAIRPDAFELWNGIDDDCDDEIDGGVNRSESTRFWPESSMLELNATEDTLELVAIVSLVEGARERLNITYIWTRNGAFVGSESTLSEAAWPCGGSVSGFGTILCLQNGTTAPYEVSVVISDGRANVSHTWWVTYTVWHPPPPLPTPEPEPEPVPEDNGTTETANEGGFSLASVKNPIVIALAGLVGVLILVILSTGKRPPKAAIPPPPRGFQRRQY
ncbi:MAG TPA: hypothetical protein EYQ80_05610 [Candidatus Poseidoniales archaeon]|nr:hypothetical protein [Candidatus Poseidoniales archaeon]